jgi:hypothetical protein
MKPSGGVIIAGHPVGLWVDSENRYWIFLSKAESILIEAGCRELCPRLAVYAASCALPALSVVSLTSLIELNSLRSILRFWSKYEEYQSLRLPLRHVELYCERLKIGTPLGPPTAGANYPNMELLGAGVIT